MRFFKKLLKNPFIIRGFSHLIAYYIKFVFITSKQQWINREAMDKLLESNTPFILCFWHNRLLMMSFSWAGQKNKMHMLISAHRDGLLISETIRHYGILSVAGSSTKGGTQALRHLLRLLKEQNYIGITPDGPRGPRFKARGGVVQIAKLAGCPILPISYSTTHRRVINSWDRFIFALPFGRNIFITGDPIYVPSSATEEEINETLLKVETTLSHISDYVDQLCGHAPIPADEGK
ncbi:hypothetical protein IM40_08680 [Candidatus Paracaedimonas acanthamoebae]|nr:hypothetical protein IM40_08680 [Candidatus Paracaedimonas acanthamoebae]